MAAFLGISIWIALATVVPGLVTITALYGAQAATGTTGLEAHFSMEGEWLPAGVAITIMILTQALGILLERALIKHKLLGPVERPLVIPPGIDPAGGGEYTLHAYEEYQTLYLLLAELCEDDDAHGHLQRALAQFFLTNNTLVSFAVGIAYTLLELWLVPTATLLRGMIYVGALIACMVVSYQVALIRFDVMLKALWAARRCRLAKA